MTTVRVASLEEARAAGGDVTPVTADGLAAFAGAGFWRAVELELGRPVVIDCGDDAGLVLAALRAGSRELLFTGPDGPAAKLADIAAQRGARLHRGLDAFAAPAPDVRFHQPSDRPTTRTRRG